MDRTLLFRTVHGSTLYNLNHPGSDLDVFEVYGWNKGRASQTIKNGIDTTQTSLDRFLNTCNKGNPQALEAMFSRKADIDLIGPIRAGYNPSLPNCRQVYSRTVRNFWEGGTPKLRRHALRLIINLRQLMESGTMDPSLTDEQLEWIEFHVRKDQLMEIL